MAKKKYGSIADDLFSDNSRNSLIDAADNSKTEQNTKKVGRPRSKDIKENDIVKRISIYFTEDMLYGIDLYALNHKMDRSEAIRYIVRSFLNNTE